MHCNGSYLSLSVPGLLPIYCTKIDFSFSCFEFSSSVSPSSFSIYLPWTKLYSLLKLFLFRLTIAPFSLQLIFGTERRWISPPMWTSLRRLTGWRSLLYIINIICYSSSLSSLFDYLDIFQPILLCVFTSWILVYFAMVKGITESPKVWNTNLLPLWTWTKSIKKKSEASQY